MTLDQALAISAQVGAVSYVETAAQFSVQETFQLFSVASVAALEARRQLQSQLGPRPGSGRNTSLSLRTGAGEEREGLRSGPSSPTRQSDPPPPPPPTPPSSSCEPALTR